MTPWLGKDFLGIALKVNESRLVIPSIGCGWRGIGCKNVLGIFVKDDWNVYRDCGSVLWVGTAVKSHEIVYSKWI